MIIIIYIFFFFFYLGRSSTSPHIFRHSPLLPISIVFCQGLPGAKVPQFPFQFRRANELLVYPFFFLTLGESILLQSCSRNIILYWNVKVDSVWGSTLPKIRIIWEKALNKSGWALNFAQSPIAPLWREIDACYQWFFFT